MRESMMKNQVFVNTPMNNKNYHIYLEDKCLFKNLNQEEFELIWDKIYRSYFKEELTYVECIDDTCIQGCLLYTSPSPRDS